MISGIKQQVIVGKGGRIEILSSELAEGTVVEVIVLVDQSSHESHVDESTQQDTTDYLLSTEENRRHLLTAIQSIENGTNLIRFTPEEWNEEYNIRP